MRSLGMMGGTSRRRKMVPSSSQKMESLYLRVSTPWCKKYDLFIEEMFSEALLMKCEHLYP